MRILKIENSQGYYLSNEGQYTALDKINKDDLLRLVDLVLDSDAEFDEFDEEKVKNQAHQIIYKSISEKLKGLKERKDEFKDETDRLYLQEYEKYKGESS